MRSPPGAPTLTLQPQSAHAYQSAMDLAAPFARLRGPPHGLYLERNGLFRMLDPEPQCSFVPSFTDEKAMDDIHAHVQEAYYNRTHWTTQDHRLAAEWSALMTAHPEHSFPNSVAYWPPWDSTVVFRDDYCSLLLGTQRTALDIPELRAHQVDVVVTLNASSRFKESYASDADWKFMYQMEGIHNLRYHLSDTRISRIDQGFHEVVADLARSWIKMIDDIGAQECSRTRPLGNLFYCLAGINRSTSALCAYLIVRYHLTAQQAIAILLSPALLAGPRSISFSTTLAIQRMQEVSPRVLVYGLRRLLKMNHQIWTNPASEVSSCGQGPFMYRPWHAALFRKTHL